MCFTTEDTTSKSSLESRTLRVLQRVKMPSFRCTSLDMEPGFRLFLSSMNLTPFNNRCKMLSFDAVMVLFYKQ